MSAKRWDEFLLDYKGPVDESLRSYIKRVYGKIAEIMGSTPVQEKKETPYVTEGEDLSGVRLAMLDAEIARLEGLLNADKLVREQYLRAIAPNWQGICRASDT